MMTIQPLFEPGAGMNRRDILRAIALGGGIVAGELWIPGQRVISIPRIYTYTKTFGPFYMKDKDDELSCTNRERQNGSLHTSEAPFLQNGLISSVSLSMTRTDFLSLQAT